METKWTRGSGNNQLILPQRPKCYFCTKIMHSTIIPSGTNRNKYVGGRLNI